MQNTSLLKTCVGCLAVGLMSGCASTTQFVPKPDLSKVSESTVFVEVHRPNGLLGCANAFTVRDNGTHIGNLGPNGYLIWKRTAGPMKLVVGPMVNLGDFSPVSINLQGATKYSFSASFPFWYPLSLNSVQQTAITALVVNQHVASLVQPQVLNAGSHKISEPVMKQVAANNPAGSLMAQSDIPTLKRRFGILFHIEDDPSKCPDVIGNGDGRIQKGEAFELVVVVSNASTTTVKAATCTITLPRNTSVKAYSELHYSVVELMPATAVTNRINLAIPMDTTLTKVPTCTIEVKESGSNVAEHVDFALPMDLP